MMDGKACLSVLCDDFVTKNGNNLTPFNLKIKAKQDDSLQCIFICRVSGCPIWKLHFKKMRYVLR